MRKERIKNEEVLIEYIHSRQFLISFFIVIGLLFAIGWSVLVWNENRIRILDKNAITPADSSIYQFYLETVEWKKDDVSITKDFVKIAGWIIKPGEPVERVAIRIVLKDMTSGDYRILPTEVIKRTDVTESINDRNNYDYCGFSVRIPYWKELDNTDYEILVQYKLNENYVVYVPLNTTLKDKAKELKNG